MSMQAALADLNDAAERIWEAASPACPALGIEVLPSAGSTNTLLLERGRQGDTAPSLLVALEQTAGRGRHGRTWQAAPGHSLTFSLGLPLNLEAVPGGGSALSLAVGLFMAEALEAGLRSADVVGSKPPPPIGLKWPNDLWVNGRKLGGILIEASTAPGLSNGQRWVVIGVGINIDASHAPAEGIGLLEALGALGARPATSRATSVMPMNTPMITPSLGQVWAWVAPALLAGVQAFEREGFAPLSARYGQRDVLRGQHVTLHRPSHSGHVLVAESQGVAKGVSETGALLVHTGQGLEQSWTSGEVSVRLARSTQAP